MAITAEDLNQVVRLSDKDNFEIWKFQVDILLKSSGLYDVIDGTNQLSECTTNEERAKWEKADAKAQRVLTTTITKSCVLHVMNCKNSKEMYAKLTNIYEGEVEQRKCRLMQEFFCYTYKKGTNMATFLSELENVAVNLKTVNNNIDDEILTSKILSTLPEQCKYFASAWESTAKIDKTLANLKSRLLIEESRVKESEDKEEAVAFKAIDKRCYNCSKTGHFAKSCRFRESSNMFKCKLCKKNNHDEKDCYFRKNKNPSHRNEKKKIAFLTSINRSCENKSIVDSGSTSHLTNDEGCLEDVKNTTIEIKVAKNNSSMEAKGIGKVRTNNCELNNVLFVPELSNKLLSVNAVTENGGKVKFTKNKVQILVNDEVFLSGRKQNGLYTINLNQSEKENSLLSEAENSDKIWHRRMGHLGKKNLEKLQKLSTGMKLNQQELECLDQVCEICQRAKQTRSPFATERTRATRPLEIVHSDVCGPVDVLTYGMDINTLSHF